MNYSTLYWYVFMVITAGGVCFSLVGKPLLIPRKLIGIGGVFVSILNPIFLSITLGGISFDVGTKSANSALGALFFWGFFYFILGYFLLSSSSNQYILCNVSISSKEVIETASGRMGLPIDCENLSLTFADKGIDLGEIGDENLKRKLVAGIQDLIKDYGKIDIKNAFFMAITFLMAVKSAY